MKIGLSLIANDGATKYQLSCGYTLVADGAMSKNLEFSLSSFRIGEGFVGQMREFKMYLVALGRESFTKSMMADT